MFLLLLKLQVDAELLGQDLELDSFFIVLSGKIFPGSSFSYF